MSSSVAPPGARRLRAPSGPWTDRAAFAVTAVFAVYFLVRLQAVIGALYANADNASALTLAEFFGERGDGHVVLGHYAWLEPLYAYRWTTWVPHHRQVWELAPLLFFVVTVALTAWATARVAGRRLGALAAAAILVPSPIIAGFVLAPNAHGHTLLHTALLAAFVITAPRLDRWSGRGRAAWAMACAALLAPGVASDVLLLIGGVAGAVVALLVGWRSRALSGAATALAGAAIAVGVAGGELLKALAEHDGVTSQHLTTVLTGADRLMPNVRLLLESLGLFAHGRFGGTLDAYHLAHHVVALVVFVGVPLLLAVGWRRAAALVHAGTLAPERLMLAVFWAAACASTAVAFVSTDAAADLFSARYLLVLGPGAVVVFALLAPQRVATTGLAALVVVTGVLGIFELARGEYTARPAGVPQGRDVGALREFVQRERLDHGYGGYWDAAVITAQTDFAVRMYPVQPCGGSGGVCPAPLHRLDRWYVPKPEPVRTFYVVNTAASGPSSLGPPPAAWGRPVAQRSFGALQVTVYDEDLAGQLAQ